MSLADPAPGSPASADRQIAADKELAGSLERLWPAVSKAFAGQRIDLLSRSAVATRVGMAIGEHATDDKRTACHPRPIRVSADCSEGFHARRPKDIRWNRSTQRWSEKQAPMQRHQQRMLAGYLLHA